MRAEPSTTDPTAYWEERYAGAGPVWSGKVNASTAAVVADLPVGSVLDLGCGEGGDALWYASEGWQVTAVDISVTAIERGRAAAQTAGVADRITWVATDLSGWRPDQDFDLVTASFFHSRVDLARTEILRRAAGSVIPGGHVLIVSHAAPPPWSAAHNESAHESHEEAAEGTGEDGKGWHHHLLPTAEEEIAELALPTDQWQVERAETRTRRATGPDGTEADLEDLVVLLRRTA